MRKMKLVPGEDFYKRCDIDVYDVTDGGEKKRCRVKAEYAAVDVRELREQGMDLEAAKEHYRQWLYDVVKHYITDDWECTEGMDEVMGIIEDHIKEYFEEGRKA